MVTQKAFRIAAALRVRGRSCRSEGGVIRLAGPDAQYTQDIGHENLAVAHLSGLRGPDDGLHHLVHELVLDRHLDPGLRNEIHDVLGSPIELRMAALPSETLDLCNGHAGNADFR